MDRKLSILIWLGLLHLVIFLPQNKASMEIKHVLRVASSLSPRYLEQLTDNGRYVRYKGFVKDFSEELANILGYQYEIVIAHDQSYGGQIRVNTSSGYWDGVFGMLLRNEADLAFGDTEVTMERAQNFDFSSPVLNTRFAVLHKRSNASMSVSSSHWTIFRPFPVAVWILFFVISILYLGFLKIHQFRPNSLKFNSIHKLKYSKKFAQIIFFTWIIFLFTSYISNYAAQKVLHATSANHATPESLVDLASENNMVKIGWLARGPVERFFRNTVNELYQKIYMQNVGRDWVSSVTDGVNKVLIENGKFAFILDSLTADHETQMDCTLYKLPQDFGPIRPIAVASPIGSPLRERVNQAVLSLAEQGVIEALSSRWFPSAKHGSCAASIAQQKVLSTSGSLQEMSPIFMMAVIGLFLATVIAVVEIQFLRKRPIAPQPKPPRQQAELLPKFNLESV